MVNVNEKLSPGSSGPESQMRLSEVAVCWTESLFVQMTLVLGSTVSGFWP